MEAIALASGSSGNCFYIENKGKGVLIDAGISKKSICKKLESRGKKPEQVKGIFITHEHIDHVRGADVFARKFNIPIFATEKTAKRCFLCSDESLIRHIGKREDINFAGMRIESFPKCHGAIEPVFFTLENKKRVSIITDAGRICRNIASHVKDADFLFLESNYDVQMLHRGPYPEHLKKWIESDEGHLSNKQAGLCVFEYASSILQRVVLSHLSEINNKPETALKTFNSLAKERNNNKFKVSLSLRGEPTELFKI